VGLLLGGWFVPCAGVVIEGVLLIDYYVTMHDPAKGLQYVAGGVTAMAGLLALLAWPHKRRPFALGRVFFGGFIGAVAVCVVWFLSVLSRQSWRM
jgi:FtsH-binding integral membrane protein